MLNDEIADKVADDKPTPSQAFWDIMDRFASARSMLNVCRRSLESSDSPVAAEETEVMAEVIEKLRAVYNEFDQFAQRAL